MDQWEILELFRRRDESALALTRSAYGGYCLKIAANILNDPRDAEEALSDALMGAWNAIPPAEPGSLRLFLGKLTRRAALRSLRYRLAQRRGGGDVPEALDELEECVPDGARVEDTVEARELSQAINEFLDGLPKADRRIFLLRYWYMEPVKDIASGLGFTQSKVKMVLKRRRDQLAERLKKEGYII